MSRSSKKFLSEFAVNLYSAGWLLFPAHQLRADGEMGVEEAELSKKCHIYLVCERPAIQFDPEVFVYSDGMISGKLLYRKQGVIQRESFCKEFPLLGDAVGVRLSQYPHREIETYDKHDAPIRYMPAFALSVMHDPDVLSHPFRQLKVLYVGQAFGGGNRTALDRLRSHSTLQKILADASYAHPDSEIVAAIFEYRPYGLTAHINGRSKDAIADSTDFARFKSIQENPLKKGQQISLVEAALIRYFQPTYNEIYKTNFPSRELKVLRECYELDFSSLIVEINTDELNFSLYSDVAAPSVHHIANIDLVDDEERGNFFRRIKI